MKYVDKGTWGNLDWCCYIYYLTGKHDSSIEDLNEQRAFYRKLVEKDLGISKEE